MKCKCGGELIKIVQCLADYPWDTEFWICGECDNAYVEKEIEEGLHPPEI